MKERVEALEGKRQDLIEKQTIFTFKNYCEAMSIIKELYAENQALKADKWLPIATLPHPNVDDERIIQDKKELIQIAESNICLLSDGKSVWSGREMIELKSKKQIPWATPLATHWQPLPEAALQSKEE